MKYSILTFFLLFTFGISAQINMRPGYIITHENDTIHGLIDFRTAIRNTTQCTFQEQGSEEIKTYTPGDIHAYRFTDDGKFYVARTVKINEAEQLFFLEYIIQGIISLYYLPETSEERYYFETENGDLVETKKNDRMVTDEKGKTGLKTDTRYLGVLTSLFGEEESIKKKIPKTAFGKEPFVKLIKEYHSEVCTTGEECIEFESKRDKKYLTFRFSAFVGGRIHSFKVPDSSPTLALLDRINSITPSLGIETSIMIPRLINTMSLRIALEGSMFDGFRNIQTPYDGYFRYDSKFLILHNRIGINYAPQTTRKIQPYFEAGYAQSFLSNHSLNYTRELNRIGEIVEFGLDYSKEMPRYYPGFYAEIGASYPLKQNKVSLAATYQSVEYFDYALRMYGIILRFTF